MKFSISIFRNDENDERGYRVLIFRHANLIYDLSRGLRRRIKLFELFETFRRLFFRLFHRWFKSGILQISLRLSSLTGDSHC